MNWEVKEGDCREVMAGMDAESIDSIVTDPPYGLSFMGKGWDHSVPGVEFWDAALRVAKPGAHLLAFGGTRLFHRLACAIEDAGWEIRDTIMWVYGSGFPKSHNGDWGGTALKPAWEPVLMARKPLDGTVAANFERYGVGGLNIDGCRVGTTVETWPSSRSFASGISSGYTSGKEKGPTQPTGNAPQGRWPANLIHDGSDEAVAGFPDTGKSLDPDMPIRRGKRTAPIYGGQTNAEGTEGFGFGDSGSAARFFYCAKANKRDRGEDNHHPTVKPTDLMAYLCRLVTPKGGIVLDPFTGSGSTGKAAVREGFGFTGIELDPEYAEIARARIEHETTKAELYA